MSEPERRGLYQFLYITACGGFEVTLAQYLASILHEPARAFGAAPVFPPRQFGLRGEPEVSVDTATENGSVHRLLQRSLRDLENAPFGKLVDHFSVVVGRTLRDELGKDSAANLEGLAALRNLFAHARLLSVDYVADASGTVRTVAVDELDRHALRQALAVLKSAGLVQAAPVKIEVSDFLALAYREDVVMHFWDAARLACDHFATQRKARGFFPYPVPPHLPTL